MRKQALFVGNGPNRLFEDSHSWSEVMRRLANETEQPSVMAGSIARPFTLIFEEMALRTARRGGSEEHLKNLVAGWMRALQPNEIHQLLMSLNTPHVLTTNYEYSLELASGLPTKSVDLHSESRYSLFRCREAGRQHVWHLHGEIDKPATIMLGHDQYVGYLHKTRNYLTTLTAKRRASKYDWRSPVIHHNYDIEKGREGYSWVDVFLRDDVHIVGFGLDYSEIGLWWLIGYKERLRIGDGRVPKGVDVGKTFFYYFLEEARQEPLVGQLQVLTDLGVRTVPIERGGSHLGGWKRISEALYGYLSQEGQ